ncbi:hypothetical protein [Paraclostridium bifermentans]|uniref:hypothetical protein n=1 Tax=Paraclostridium bifermentans TaxID=1490 RepID=UPI0018AC5696|nr:hypothetical protein [Paraclostridium bifermentans]
MTKKNNISIKKVTTLFIILFIISLILLVFSFMKIQKIETYQENIFTEVDNKINSLTNEDITKDSNAYKRELQQFLSNDKFNSITLLKVFSNAPIEEKEELDFRNLKLEYVYSNTYTKNTVGLSQLSNNPAKDGNKLFYEVDISAKEYNLYGTLFATCLFISIVLAIISTAFFIKLNKI